MFLNTVSSLFAFKVLKSQEQVLFTIVRESLVINNRHVISSINIKNFSVIAAVKFFLEKKELQTLQGSRVDPDSVLAKCSSLPLPLLVSPISIAPKLATSPRNSPFV